MQTPPNDRSTLTNKSEYAFCFDDCGISNRHMKNMLQTRGDYSRPDQKNYAAVDKHVNQQLSFVIWSVTVLDQEKKQSLANPIFDHFPLTG